KFRDENDEYDIQLRFQEAQRKNIESLLNSKITYRDMNMGGRMRSIPLSAFTTIEYSDTYGGIKRKNQKRVVTVESNILGGFSNNQVVADIQKVLPDFPQPEGVVINMTGEQEDQAETQNFIGLALMMSIGIILLILVLQFNSISKPIIILTEIIFSIIGVFLGFYIFDMEVSIFMTGIGIVTLAGIVVRNGILLVEFTEVLEKQGMNTFDAIVLAGKTRMTPVLMTASATILGLVPLAIGLNIDFVTLFTEFNPHFFLGGDSVAFWGPLSWTLIFGLGFATFLTLVLVPAMYLLVEKLKARLKKKSI
ncbi:MAG TPA: copper transporter, partial [Cytophagales bacterium]|nr:copper transporter [Cytophagales bacterium]